MDGYITKIECPNCKEYVLIYNNAESAICGKCKHQIGKDEIKTMSKMYIPESSPTSSVKSGNGKSVSETASSRIRNFASIYMLISVIAFIILIIIGIVSISGNTALGLATIIISAISMFLTSFMIRIVDGFAQMVDDTSDIKKQNMQMMRLLAELLTENKRQAKPENRDIFEG